ncbi:MAG: glycosyltransferase [Spirochaetota bacterium]
MKKLVVLHPPFYPTNYGFYHALGKQVDLCVFMFGDRPKENPSWAVDTLYKPGEHSFRLRLFGSGTYPKAELYSPRFLAALRKESPDAVLTVAFAPYGFYAGLCAKLLGYRFYLFCDSTAESEAGLSALRCWSRRFLLRLCRKALAASRGTTAYFKGLCPGVEVVEGLQAADFTLFLQRGETDPKKREALRREWAARIGERRWGESASGAALKGKAEFIRDFVAAPVWLGVGRMIPTKRWHWGLQLLRAQPRLHYVLVGKGEAENSLVQQAKELGVEQRFHLLPFAEALDLVRYYSAADLLYFPSECDPFGFVVGEALCCGLPVLCSRQIGAAFLIEENVNGFFGVEGEDNKGALGAARIEQILAASPGMREACRDGAAELSVERRAAGFARAMELLNSV